MQHFQYKYGDRPLEGYTIQRAAGRGGFGEVYYAVSDGGRQVALKVIQNYEQIELRGITQCMNLKSPHLVTIFDVVHNTEGMPFVIMEYVSGPSLRDLIDNSPSGLGPQKAAFFLREIAKGLSYLHECGIVHRDLKPGNIFYENGYVKIGDYGLSKAISQGIHSGQTITVGTVHYMAPEIGAGCYDCSIDIYALGVLVYEMLTGQVPFFGSSPGEILMKHITAEPDLSDIDEPFKRVIQKALAKDPNERYRTVQEMVEDVFGAAHVRNSVSQFSPESLSMVAAHVAGKGKIGDSSKNNATEAAPRKGTHMPDGHYVRENDPAAQPFKKKMEAFGSRMEEFGRRMEEKADHIGSKFGGGDYARKKPLREEAGRWKLKLEEAMRFDPTTKGQRGSLTIITMIVIAVVVGLFMGGGNDDDLFGYGGMSLLMMFGATSGIFLSERKITCRLESESSWLRRLIMGSLGFAAAMLLSLPLLSEAPMHGSGKRGMMLAIFILILLIDWTELMNPTREHRQSLGAAIGWGIIAAVAAEMFNGPGPLIIGVISGTILAVQVASPFVPQAARKHYKKNVKLREMQPHSRREWDRPVRDRVYPHGDRPERGDSGGARKSAPHRGTLPAPAWMKPIWLTVFIAALTATVMLIMLPIATQDDDMTFPLCLGGPLSLMLTILSIKRLRQRTFGGWFGYLIKPVIMMVCFQAVFFSFCGIILGDARGNDMIPFLFFIIFPSILFFVLLFTPARKIDGEFGFNGVSETIRATHMVSPYKRSWALLCSAGIFLGFGGLHRFYVGRTTSGIIWLLTGGLLGIGQLVDFINILAGNFRDQYGFPLRIWFEEAELAESGKKVARQEDLRRRESEIEQEQVHARSDEWEERGAIPAAPPPPREHPAVQPAGDSGSFPDSGTAMTSSVYREPFRPLSFLAGSTANILLMVCGVLGLILAVRLPSLVAETNLLPDVKQEITKAFGTSQWLHVMERIVMIMMFTLYIMAVGLTIFSRRFKGAEHIGRCVLGFLCFFFTFTFLSEAIFYESYLAASWVELLENMYFSRKKAMGAAGLFVLGVVLLCWPPKANKPTLPVATTSQNDAAGAHPVTGPQDAGA